MTPSPNTNSNLLKFGRQQWLALPIFILVVGLLLVGMVRYYPPAVDWEYTFAATASHWRDPYAIETFTSPPWLIALLPHAWLPLAWGNALNLCLNILMIALVIRRFNGGWPLMLLVYTSPPFLDLVRTNNVDWIPLLALLLPPMWGLPILALKPHTLGAVALIWWKRSTQKIRLITPLLVVVALSLLIWGMWPLKIQTLGDVSWNFAPWPFGIPLGIYMLYRAYRTDDEFLAAASTPFLVPYIAPYSIAGLLAFAGCKYRREAFFVYVAFWVYFIVESRRMAIGSG